MAIFGFFAKKKILKIGSREIEIINKTYKCLLSARLVKEAEQAIEYFGRNDKIAEFFPRLTFVLKWQKPWIEILEAMEITMVGRKVGWVRPKDISKGNMIIYIVLDALSYDSVERGMKISDALRATCRHEATHIYHIMVNENLVLRRRSIKRLRKIAGKNKKTIEHSLKRAKHDKPFLETLRTILVRVLCSIHMEGVARYIEKESELPFNEVTFRELYSDAQGDVEKINNFAKKMMEVAHISSFKEILERYRKMKEVMITAYPIGLHMVYTILYSNHDMDMEKIFHLRHFRFIKEYEKCCEQAGYRPVVSLLSGKGIFDYKRALGEMENQLKSLQKFREV